MDVNYCFLFLLALPYFFDDDQVDATVKSNTVNLTWNSWEYTKDFGTGPVDHYRVFYWTQDAMSAQRPFRMSAEPIATISDLDIESVYYFAVSAVKIVGGQTLDGPSTRTVSATTGCGGMCKISMKTL